MSIGAGRHSVWRAGSAVMVALALLMQAALIGATAPIPAPASHLSGTGLCTHTGFGDPAELPDGAPQHDRHDGCCVLCSSPGLDGSGAAPVWYRPEPVRAAADIPRVFASLAGPIERLPGEPRAPPRAA